MSSPYPPGSTGNNPHAIVTLEEAVGPDMDIATVSDVVLLAVDQHATEALAYALNPLTPTQKNSYERWLRLKFQPPFGTISRIRLWAQGFSAPGWALYYGTTSTYDQPVLANSYVATTEMPMEDPGSSGSNLGPDHLDGTGTGYSDWIVIQARVNPNVASPGPILGFAGDSILPLNVNVAWNES